MKLDNQKLLVISKRYFWQAVAGTYVIGLLIGFAIGLSSRNL